ncbi:MAG TPA: ABC transporter ATP-binding protein, partial [Pseudoduganella sp.]
PQSMYEMPDSLFAAEFMGSNDRLPAKVLSRNGESAELEIEGVRMRATARGAANGSEPTVLIRIEEIVVGTSRVDNAIELPLLTCMYLGDRWECLFKRGDTSLRAYARQRLDAGSYWLHMPPEKLWLF